LSERVKDAFVSIFFFMVCMMLAANVLQAMGIAGVPLTPADPDQFSDAWNSTALLSTWGWTNPQFYDLLGALRFLWDVNVPFIEAAPALLQSLGTPGILVDVYKVVWRGVCTWFIISRIGGWNL